MTSLIDQQITTELKFSKKAIMNLLEEEIQREPELVECLDNTQETILEWATTFTKYESKKIRLANLIHHNDLEALIKRAMCLVLELNTESDLLTSIAGQLAGHIQGMESYKDKVTTAAEILVHMCDEDCFDMDKRSYQAEDSETFIPYTIESWFISNPWELSRTTVNHMRRAKYPLPMICKPSALKNNNDSGYLTVDKDSLILGKGNYHDGEICLKSLERFSNIPLCINEEFVNNVDSITKEKWDAMSDETKLQYEKFTQESAEVFAYLVKSGNKFYLNHKTDKRGRTYAQGYHVTTQGNAFRKGAVELATKQAVTGEF